MGHWEKFAQTLTFATKEIRFSFTATFRICLIPSITPIFSSTSSTNSQHLLRAFLSYILLQLNSSELAKYPYFIPRFIDGSKSKNVVKGAFFISTQYQNFGFPNTHLSLLLNTSSFKSMSNFQLIQILMSGIS